MIMQFRGRYYFLSNFYHHKFTYKGVEYYNSEAAFQAQKCINEEDKMALSNMESPMEAKKYGKTVALREDWEDVKNDIMYSVLMAKFSSDEELKRKLLDTGEEELVEGNTWGDSYWGFDLEKNEGKNILGKLLMQVRKDLSEK